jgi:hypothetical protein
LIFIKKWLFHITNSHFFSTVITDAEGITIPKFRIPGDRALCFFHPEASNFPLSSGFQPQAEAS